MRQHPHLLTLCVTAIALGYLTNHAYAQASNPTVKNFLQCVGLKSMNMTGGQNNSQIADEVLEEFTDVYTFVRSSFSRDSILELFFSLHNSSANQSPQDLGFIKLWFQVNLRPFLARVSKESLSCLSGGNFSCETYQAIVKEISLHFSSLDPARQKWIYKHFVYSFLARNSTAGCVSSGETSEVWLKKNFGAFAVVSQLRDFTTLNTGFNALEVLHLLTPVQKAELLLSPELGHLDDSTLAMVFESLLKPLLNHSGPVVNSSSPGLGKSKGFLKKLKPLGRFIGRIVNFIHRVSTPSTGPAWPPPCFSSFSTVFYSPFSTSLLFQKLGSFARRFQLSDLTSLKSHKVAQAVLNYTLAELVAILGNGTNGTHGTNGTKPTPSPFPASFNISDVHDWYQHVVVPLIRRFLPHNESIPPELTAAFIHAFSGNSDPEPSDPPDICHAPVDVRPCALANSVEVVDKIFNCVDQTNLTAEHLKPLMAQLIAIVEPLIQQRCGPNSSVMASKLCSSLSLPNMDNISSENFQDVESTQIFFQTKIRPFLPSISGDFLRCVLTRNLSCPSYQTLVKELSNHTQSLGKNRQMLVYTNFINPFLSRQMSADPSCISQTNGSRDWVMKNFGRFSVFAPLQDFFSLNSNFSALETLNLLSPRQTAELVVSPHPALSDKEAIINAVFDHFMESPNDMKQREFLREFAMLSQQRPLNCSSIQTIIKRLRHSLSSMPGRQEPVIWASINVFMQAGPRREYK
ncbi:uncharacterized protein LOC133114197 [Conger conger]|uniref:uncharacterized protein LOC133114197 n=1 Tax=Conger conger TaxID=82655 RepID=UPI002A5A6BE8|nr:uncharacterized protein LOC133114197 [Conger conger]